MCCLNELLTILQQIFCTVALIVAPVLAIPSEALKGDIHSSPLAIRKSCAATCGSVCYTSSAIDAAINKGFDLFEEDETEGSDKYPHTYNDFEGFQFPVDGPYQEFPILSNGKVYSGGSPGADRVVFNQDGDFAGVITHTGASGNDFVSC